MASARAARAACGALPFIRYRALNPRWVQVKMRADEQRFIRPQTLQCVGMDYYFTPIFLRISLGTTFLFTMISIVLYSTKGREK